MGFRKCLSDDNIARLKNRDEVIHYMVDEFDKSDLTLREWKRDITTYYELYMMVQRRRHYQGMANIFVPETLRAVETIVTKIYQMIFGQSDWFEYDGRDNDGEEKSALALTELTLFQMDENNFKSRIMDAIRQMVLAGVVVRKVLWDFQEVDRTIGYEDDGKTEKKSTETTRDTWTLEPVDLLTFQISDINVPYNNCQRANWIGEQYIWRKELVREKQKKGWFSRSEQNYLDDQDEAKQSQNAADVKNRENSSGFINIPSKGKYELMEYWGLLPCRWVYSDEEMKKYEFDDEDKCEGVIVIANRVAILKLEKNPFWHNQKPYLICPYVPKEFEVVGLGAAQIGRSLQEELNDTRNAVMDNKTLVLSTMWLKSRTSGIKNSDLQMRPNGVITTNDMEGLTPLRPPELSGPGVAIEGIIKNDLRESVGAASNLQGIAQTGVDTATESTQINQESLGRLATASQLFSELILKPMLVFAEYLNYQFYDHEKVINIIGKNGVKFVRMSPKDIAGGHKNVIIKVALDATENPAIRRQQMMNFFTLIQQMPPQAIMFHWKILNKIYSMFFNGHTLDELYENNQPDPDDILTPEEQRDIVIAEKPCLAGPGENHIEYAKYLKKEYDQMKHALNQIQLMLFQKLIMSHMEAAKAEIDQKTELIHQQMLQTQAAASQQILQKGQRGQKSGNIVNRGQTSNTTPYNQTAAPTIGGMRQELGG